MKRFEKNFFSAKSFVVTWTNFPPGWFGWKIAFPSLNYDRKVGFWPFSVFSACFVQYCSHSTASTSVQLASLESSDPFYPVGLTRKSLWGSQSPSSPSMWLSQKQSLWCLLCNKDTLVPSLFFSLLHSDNSYRSYLKNLFPSIQWHPSHFSQSSDLLYKPFPFIVLFYFWRFISSAQFIEQRRNKR